MLPVLNQRAAVPGTACVAIGIARGPAPSLFELSFSLQ